MEDYFDDIHDYWFGGYHTARKTKLIANDSTKHYPNKDEARELRKIMASTGLTEEQVRADKKYRIMLSEAQKSGQKAKRGEIEKYYQKMIKSACKTTGLAPQHPETMKVIEELLDKQNPRWRRRFFYYNPLTTAKKVIELYAKK